MRYAILFLVVVGCGPESAKDGQDLGFAGESGESGESGDPSDTDASESSGEPAPETPLPDPDRQAPADLAGEPCAELAMTRYCGDDEFGEVTTQVQACAASLEDDGLVWSECDVTISCTPGDTLECVDGLSTVSCVILDGGELGFEDCGFTPLAIDLGNEGFAFEPAAAAAFDIAANGACLEVDWPIRSTAWLALDRDGDGAIADGSELFGSGTPMPLGVVPTDGFAALASLDDDHDGVITDDDAGFAGLVLWSDHDGDRRGTSGELMSLAQVGITSLPLAYERRRECDERGNCVVERASVTTAEGPRALVDLHLACQ